MHIDLALHSESDSREDLQKLTFDLAADINRHTDATAAAATQQGNPGEKGDAITLATLALSFLSSGTAVALFQVFKAYFERNRTLIIELKRPDGSELKFKAENISRARTAETMEALQKFMEASS